MAAARASLIGALVLCAALALSCSSSGAEPRVARAAPIAVVPAPAELERTGGAPFVLTGSARIRAPRRALDEARQLGRLLRPSTGYRLPVARRGSFGNLISLRLSRRSGLGREGYRLVASTRSVRIVAATRAGLFRGIQTLRQLLPAKVESRRRRAGPWVVPAVRIADRPRYAWRGAGLDVARRWFTVRQVERFIDMVALYKVNRLHLHLTDDQGWRLFISSWPRLTEVGGRTEVGGGFAGWYSQDDYRRIVRYAAARHMAVVPEIEMPGHTNAALSAYAELNCDGRARPVFTGVGVGFSSLCVEKEITYRFVADVVRELAALTPGRYLHIGGDEAFLTDRRGYARFVERVQAIVRANGKRPVGWEEIGRAALRPPVLVQRWHPGPSAPLVRRAVARGARVIASPADHVYLDMKYTPATPVGLDWAGHVEVRDAYAWNPARLLDGVRGRAVAGVEAPLWGDTLRDFDDVEFMTYPRLPAVAEVGWSRRGRSWRGFRRRLARHGARWKCMGVRFYRSPSLDRLMRGSHRSCR